MDPPLSREYYTDESEEKDNEDDDPVAAFMIRGFLFLPHLFLPIQRQADKDRRAWVC
jgi:hypothetical protein